MTPFERRAVAAALGLLRPVAAAGASGSGAVAAAVRQLELVLAVPPGPAPDPDARPPETARPGDRPHARPA